MIDPEPHPLRLEIPRRLAGKRLDHALAELVPGHTRAQVQKLVRRGKVKLDGKKVLRSNRTLQGGEALLVHVAAAGAPKPPTLEWIHIDPLFAVAAKPPGMLTHPTERQRDRTLADYAVERFGPLPSVEDSHRPGIVHRLDRGTSGVMVIAREPAALDALRQQFREHTVEKRYLALVHGNPPEDRFEVERALSAVPGSRDLQRPDPAGRSAFTSFQVLRRFRSFALVECRPTTGRRHQLRVHLWSLGHPVVSDDLYRPDAGAVRLRGLRYQALHAEYLAFDHPGDGRRVEFHAPPPAALVELWDGLDAR